MKYSGIKHFPSNWTNGMKLTADHFQHLEDSTEAAASDARATAVLSNVGYGLLPESKFTIRNAEGQTTQTVRVILEACQAILPGGRRIEILPNNIKTIQIPKQAPFVEFIPNAGVRYHLFLTVDEYSRIGSGIPETRPIREPFLCHDYQIECIPHDKIGAFQNLAADRMKIGEWKDGKILDGYIPPCMNLRSYPLLEKWHLFFQNQLENIVKISAHVINENRKKDPARAVFCEIIVQHIRSNQGEFRWMLPEKSPVHFVSYFGDFAGLVKGLLETSDRDFVRNVLQNGEINGLLASIESLLKLKSIPMEDLANVILKIKKIIDALLATIQSLVSDKAHSPRMGDRNIASG